MRIRVQIRKLEHVGSIPGCERSGRGGICSRRLRLDRECPEVQNHSFNSWRILRRVLVALLFLRRAGGSETLFYDAAGRGGTH